MVESFDGNAFRAVYTVKFSGVVYALHAFQKKSTKGIKTAPADIQRIKERLKIAMELHAAFVAEKEKSDEEAS